MTFRFVANLAAGALLSLLSLHANAATVWFADDDKLYLLNPATNSIAHTVNIDGVRSLTVASDGSAWVLTKKRLTRCQTNGTVATDLELKSLALKDADSIALNSRDGSLWLAEGEEDGEREDDDGNGKAKRIVRLNAAGTRVQDFTSPGSVRALVVALDQTLWLLGKKHLWHYSSNGALLASVDLKQATKASPELVAVDSVGVWLWMADEKQLWRLDGDALALAPLKISLSKKAEAISLDPASGTVWIATDSTLQAYGQDGALKKSIDLKTLDIKDPKSLTFDSANAAIWLSHKKALSRFGLDGSRVAVIAVKDTIEAVGVAPFALLPTVSVLSPADGALTGNPQPHLKLSFGATCNASPCGFSPDYFLTYRLSATLNGAEVGGQFALQPGTTESVLVPSSRLPEGQVMLTASVTDSFGQRSEPAVSRFTVDTVPPAITALSPADGALFNSPLVTITGVLSEAANIRITGPGGQTALTGTAFTLPVTLVSGANLFHVTAKDAAGNQTTRPLTFVLDNSPPVLSGLPPADGVTVESSVFSMEGSANETATFTLSKGGVSQTAQGITFRFNAELSPGLNVFTLTATDLAGNQTVREVKVTRQAAGINTTLSAPLSGAIYSSPALISISAEAISQSSGIQRVEFLLDGVVVATVSTAPFAYELSVVNPGGYVLKTRAFDQSGAIALSNEVRVQVLDTPERAARAAWGEFTAALIGGTPQAALSRMSPAAKEKFGPVFKVLDKDLPSIARGWSAPLEVDATEGYAEIAINRLVRGQLRLYFVYLVRGADGSWQVEEM